MCLDENKYTSNACNSFARSQNCWYSLNVVCFFFYSFTNSFSFWHSFESNVSIYSMHVIEIQRTMLILYQLIYVYIYIFPRLKFSIFMWKSRFSTRINVLNDQSIVMSYQIKCAVDRIESKRNVTTTMHRFRWHTLLNKTCNQSWRYC